MAKGLVCPLPQQTFCTNKIESSRWVNKCVWNAALPSHCPPPVQSCSSQSCLRTHCLRGQTRLGALIISLKGLASSASRSSMTCSIQLVLSAHSLASSLMFPWSEALGLSCTCSLSTSFTETVCSLRESSEPVRKEMMGCTNHRGRVRHIKNDISAVIPQGLELSWYVFTGNSSSLQAFIFFYKGLGAGLILSTPQRQLSRRAN